MGLNSLNLTFFFLLFFFLLSGFAFSTHIISNAALEARETIGRSLLQARTECDEDFQQKNYTIITSRCKGPKYPRDSCCNALSDFACPFVEKINNESTNCASTMFSYINLYGKYPPGLFANLCTKDKEGLLCPEAPDSGAMPFAQPALLLLTSAFLVTLSHLR
ncbi:LORELEI-LIKE-GPI ANCHORED PROTEIN 3 [Hibiscus trionum]|uniref:LORELEI-LIKE-GPI ANCHORED PROTEIN 3 n=1 Tax=Hibiscus trionum TaxID=183268 RepID=A0A9W7HCY0_HIBTR|nr:LORELEI-LIKE-GPI ANCHORED PROTEIN 3 [Hibiscus trionum]